MRIMNGDERLEFPPFPGDSHPAPGGALAICQRTVAYPSGTASEALTAHYRRAHPEELGQPPAHAT
jgi:hypothetical protein